MTLPDEERSPEIPQVINLGQSTSEVLQADMVRASESVIGKVAAEDVELNLAAAGAVQAQKFRARRSAVGLATSASSEVRESLVGAVRADQITLSGYTGLVAGRTLHTEELASGVVLAAEVNAPTIQTGILLSRQVNGNVQTLLSTRQALLGGLVGGIVAGLVMLVGRLVFGRRK